MLKEIIVHVFEGETRVAVMENQQLVEIFIERAVDHRLVGNIYKGRVENVLPGMQAAFVNIGLEKNAFLYVEDAIPLRQSDEEPGKTRGEPRVNIGNVLKVGQDILVQITKEPIGTKGARVTTHITIPGRYLVLMPTVDYIGISRRIENEEERERIKNLAEKVKPAGMGLIVRTVAEGVGEEQLELEVRGLVKLWKRIQQRSQVGPSPQLIHKELELIQRILRDIFTDDVDRLLINSRWAYKKVQEWLEIESPNLKNKVFLVEQDLFEKYGLDLELDRALKRKVWLKCGGYLVIDQTEALTAIDINTGKYVGSTNLADTVLKTNLEAAVEIPRQLRLRNIGGIIIIDFIDMDNPEDQAQVLKTLEMELSKDKTRSKILGLTQLGLVEMTRKKVQQGLDSILQRACPYCEGKGRVLSEETVMIQAKKRIMALAELTDAPAILVEAYPTVASLLIGSGGSQLRELERRTGKQLIIKGVEGFHLENFQVRGIFAQREIDELAVPVKVGQILEVKVEEPHAINPYDGIARLHGFVLDIEGAGTYIGEQVLVEITKVFRTYARAKLLANGSF
ncbi:MAG: Rne/Rng family ribonuclease [Firmicutes bacterium]|nr:Rne/Rng family ribonuclease [Bacillota bacterium]